MGDSLDIRPLSEMTGAEILGFDFSRPATAEATRGWHEALDQFQLLVFRDAQLDAPAQVDLLETLGPALIENDAGRAYQFVSNTHEEGILGDEAFAFHSDHAFMPDPIEVIALHALELPARGTQTRFVNALAAAEHLPEGLRRKIHDYRGRHIINPLAKSNVIPVRGEPLSADLPHAYHPVLASHPRTGKEILYVSEQQTDQIESLSKSAGRELIEALFDHLYATPFFYDHVWRENDLLLWDNRALQHARDAIAPGDRRTLRRVSIGGTSVYDFFKNHEKWSFEQMGAGESDR